MRLINSPYAGSAHAGCLGGQRLPKPPCAVGGELIIPPAPQTDCVTLTPFDHAILGHHPLELYAGAYVICLFADLGAHFLGSCVLRRAGTMGLCHSSGGDHPAG